MTHVRVVVKGLGPGRLVSDLASFFFFFFWLPRFFTVQPVCFVLQLVREVGVGAEEGLDFPDGLKFVSVASDPLNLSRPALIT